MLASRAINRAATYRSAWAVRARDPVASSAITGIFQAAPRPPSATAIDRARALPCVSRTAGSSCRRPMVDSRSPRAPTSATPCVYPNHRARVLDCYRPSELAVNMADVKPQMVHSTWVLANSGITSTKN